VATDDKSALTFAGLLRRLRAEAGLTQEELAQAAGVSVRSVSDLERGVNLTARKSTAGLLAAGLGLTDPAREAFEAAATGRASADGFPTGGAAAIRTLPRDIASFTGREPELRHLAAASVGDAGAVSIQAIGGMAGIGKTAFAVHAAHQLASRFPAGQIFLPLHGHTPGHRPVDPADALASLLLTAGVPAGQIPPSVEARAALWRDRLADGQWLLVLDDAASSEQIAPLLPGSLRCLVLVTSRRHLTALPDAHAITLGILASEQAAELLVRLADRPGLGPADAAVGEITRLCGYLPLAVGMLARQLHHHPAWTPAGLADELAAARDRLELMTTENLSVTAAFDLSYADLAEDQQRLFRRLSLHPGIDIDAYAAAALDGTDPVTAHRHLEALYGQCLLDEPTAGRFRPHDLIRAHARALAARADPSRDQDQAVGRLLDYYQDAAARAETSLARQTPIVPAPADRAASSAAIPEFTDSTQALAWAQAERANLLACLDHAARVGQHRRVVALTAGLAALLRRDGPWSDAITCHTTAVQAARHLGDRLGEAGAQHNLGIAYWLTAEYASAAETLEAALGIYRELGHRLGQANTLDTLGGVRRVTGDYQGAAEAQEVALGIYRDLRDRLGQANAVRELGVVRRMTGDYGGAVDALETALGIYRELGHRLSQANTLIELGFVRRLTGDYRGAAKAQEAALGIAREIGHRLAQASALSNLGIARRLAGDHLGTAEAQEAALGIYRDLGNRLGQANTLIELGVVRRLAGDYRGAAEALEAALRIFRALGDRGGAAETLNELGTLHRVRGDIGQAEAHHQQALDLAREIASYWDEAHALAGLSRCALAAGRTVDAQDYLLQAQEIFQRIGAVDAGSI
jgi:tetratricopeptide (TPR) repeat protein/transcriptional regulator with XRE-family HTH domain